MKITITQRIDVETEIDIEYPYYYKHDLKVENEKSIIYGKIEESMLTTIMETITNKKSFFIIEKEPFSSLKESYMGLYFENEFASNENEFLQAKGKAIDFINLKQ